MNNGEFYMDDEDSEMVLLLQKLNVSKPVAKTLACLLTAEKITSREVEMMSRLRQPEVSIAMTYLQKNNWVEVEEVKKKQGKGRPIKVYTLTVPMDEIINTIEQKVISENQMMLENIERLKDLS
ncbi:transcriptional regulator [Methanococcoides methylutens]|uniref:Transcriptional regulator n=1 Tax=Methanococcoides methylutens TaxID=2226 RepID=A0A099T2I8_METMT|nr:MULTISPECIES: transcriptional regulator [Methanococcoides]KGK99332.1 transcriptional regulator [Methanococcoides methylutens]